MSPRRPRPLSDAQWALIEPLLPSNAGRRGRPFGENRRVLEGIVHRYRTGVAWRDLPRTEFGAWQTVWKRQRRYERDGTWDRVLSALLAEVDPDVAQPGSTTPSSLPSGSGRQRRATSP